MRKHPTITYGIRRVGEPLPTLPRKWRWRVDWQRVAEGETWLEKHPVEKRPPDRAYGGLVIYGPENAGTIQWVLLSCCAGYAKAPRAEDVIRGIESTRPTATEIEAVRTFLLEAKAEQVRKAWKAREFTLTELMKTVEHVVEKDDVRTTRSIREWLIIEPAGT